MLGHRGHAFDGAIVVGRSLQLGHTEIQNLDAAVVGDEQILRLEVAMNDVAIMRSGESMGDLESIVGRLGNRDRAFRQPLAQVFPFQQLRNDVGNCAFEADVINRKNVGWFRAAAARASCSKRRR